MNVPNLDLYAVVTLAVLVVALPLLGLWDMARLRRWLAAGRPDARLAMYRETIIMEWGVVAVLLGWWLALGRPLAPLGLLPRAEGWQWLAVGTGLALAAGMIWQWLAVVRNPASLAEVRAKAGDLEAITPRGATERRAFDRVSLTAGICEEVLYRGILLALLTGWLGTWPAVVLSALAFGLAHAYQGPTGIAKTAGVGLVMALLTVLSGSIFPAVVLHVVIDVSSGRMMSAALEAEPSPTPA